MNTHSEENHEIGRGVLNILILDCADQRPSGVQTIGEQEECHEIDEGLWEMAYFFERKPDLLPSDREVVAPLGKFGTGTRLLVDEPPYA